ncbi:MAG: GTP cyclohydrolase I [Nocardiopsaceae bacterium]|nr:GTP cyclohydrolase I [Nocardiopsaceae bacterium]
MLAPPATGNGHAPLASAAPSSPVDVAAAERAVADLLRALGVPEGSEVAANTPRRVCAALAELFSPPAFELATFPNTHGHGDLVLVRDVPFTSLCAHHLLPFAGSAQIGYLPGSHLAGLSKLARAVRCAAGGLRLQEEIGQQVASFLDASLDCAGVGVLLTAEHQCMTARGAKAHAAGTVTLALRGALRDDPLLRAEFLALAVPGRR